LYRYANQRVLLGVLLYGVVLLPVAQVVPVGQALVADRYSYLPFIGLLLLLSALLQEILRKFSLRENQLLLAMIPLCIVLAWACRDRIQVWQNSITLYQDVLLQYPSYSTGYVNYGNALRDKGDWQKAEQAYWLGVYSDPKNDLPWNNLGILASFRKQPERAVYFYSRAAELKPGFPINQYNIATVWFNQGKPAQALPAVEEALKIDPNYGEALHLRGVLLQQLQRYDESIASLLQAMKQKPEEIQILNDLGTTYFYAQKIGEAEAAFQKSIALDPSNNPNAYNNIGFVLFNSGRQEEAIEMYRKAAAQGHPEAAAYLRQLGR
jgi:tetratricopeptide (TPR) repeat protein